MSGQHFPADSLLRPDDALYASLRLPRRPRSGERSLSDMLSDVPVDPHDAWSCVTARTR